MLFACVFAKYVAVAVQSTFSNCCLQQFIASFNWVCGENRAISEHNGLIRVWAGRVSAKVYNNFDFGFEVMITF